MSNPAKAIGVDFGGTGIKPAVVQGGAIIQRGAKVDTRKHLADGTLFDALFDAIAALR